MSSEYSEKDTARMILGLVGIARRAGKLTFGFDAVLKDVEKNRTGQIFLSEDASERTARKIKNACYEHKIQVTGLKIPKLDLGAAIGRGEAAVISISDSNLAGRISELSKLRDNTA